MADVPAANVTVKERISLGNKLGVLYKFQGDSSGTTLVIPLGRPEGAFLQSIGAATALGVTLSGQTVTFSAAPATGAYYYLLVIGTD